MLLGRTAEDPRRTEKMRQVKDWVREQLSLPPEVSVMVTELRCTEPGCPPTETVIAVLWGPGNTRQQKIPRAVVEVSSEEVAAVCPALRSP